MRNKYIKRSGFGRRALEQNILIHGKGNGIDSWSILVDVIMTALFKTHNINEWTSEWTVNKMSMNQNSHLNVGS